jgi:hypothetical protein
VRTKGWMALWLCFVVVACCSCASEEASSQARKEGVYTRYNLHYIVEHGFVKGSFANWTDWPGHAFLPYNSKVRAETWINRSRFETDADWRSCSRSTRTHGDVPASTLT